MFKSGFNLWTFWLTPNELFSLKRGPARVSKNSVSKGPQTIFVDCSQRIIVWNRPTKLTLRQSVIHITTDSLVSRWHKYLSQFEHNLTININILWSKVWNFTRIYSSFYYFTRIIRRIYVASLRRSKISEKFPWLPYFRESTIKEGRDRNAANKRTVKSSSFNFVL